MEGLDYPILDPASQHVVHAAASWPIPPEAVGPMVWAAIGLLLLIAFWDHLSLVRGPRR